MPLMSSIRRFFTEGRTAPLRALFVFLLLSSAAAGAYFFSLSSSLKLLLVLSLMGFLMAGIALVFMVEASRRVIIRINQELAPRQVLQSRNKAHERRVDDLCLLIEGRFEQQTLEAKNQWADIQAIWRRIDEVSEAVEATSARARRDLEEVRNESSLKISQAIEEVKSIQASDEMKIFQAIEEMKSAQASDEMKIWRAIEEMKSSQAKQASQASAETTPAHLRIMDRQLGKEDKKELLSVWSQKLGIRVSGTELDYMAHRVRSLEEKGIGRFACSVQAAILRILAARSLPRDSIRVLEIGTLFGFGAATVYDGCRGFFDRVDFTLIDPLTGYYGESRPDPITGAVPIKSALRVNLGLVGLSGDNLQIIEALSTDYSTVLQLDGEVFDLLIIDGDHSAHGVSTDFDWFAPMIRRRGLILFDDYGNRDWPAVKRFVDSDVVPRKEVNLIASGYNTAIFRVQEPIPALPRSGAES